MTQTEGMRVDATLLRSVLQLCVGAFKRSYVADYALIVFNLRFRGNTPDHGSFVIEKTLFSHPVTGSRD